MPLQPGTTLGPYSVTAKIGEGGMGEVWQARDTKLDRDVALKVLPEAFTSDPDRLARFEREAKVLASLNHPNIGSIYGLEEAEGVRALVLELVEGPTLADRIKRGPIPLDEFQHERPDALSLLQPVDTPDVGVVQRGQHLGFALEAGQPVGVGREGLGQHLQRHVPVELRVAGLPDFRCRLRRSWRRPCRSRGGCRAVKT